MTGCIIHIEREEALKVDPTCAEAWRSKSGACRLQFEGLLGRACWAGPRERKEPEAKSLCVILWGLQWGPGSFWSGLLCP